MVDGYKKYQHNTWVYEPELGRQDIILLCRCLATIYCDAVNSNLLSQLSIVLVGSNQYWSVRQKCLCLLSFFTYIAPASDSTAQFFYIVPASDSIASLLRNKLIFDLELI